MTRTDTGDTLADRLRGALQREGLSQRQLAARLAGPKASGRKIENWRRQVVRWANGKSLPDDSSAARLAQALGMGDDAFVPPAEVRPLGVARELERIDRRYDDLEERVAALERALRDALEILRDDPPARSQRRRGS